MLQHQPPVYSQDCLQTLLLIGIHSSVDASTTHRVDQPDLVAQDVSVGGGFAGAEGNQIRVDSLRDLRFIVVHEQQHPKEVCTQNHDRAALLLRLSSGSGTDSSVVIAEAARRTIRFHLLDKLGKLWVIAEVFQDSGVPEIIFELGHVVEALLDGK